jgi:hypothetical protein
MHRMDTDSPDREAISAAARALSALGCRKGGQVAGKSRSPAKLAAARQNAAKARAARLAKRNDKATNDAPLNVFARILEAADAHLSAGAKELLRAASAGMEKRTAEDFNRSIAVPNPFSDGLPMNPDLEKMGECFAKAGAKVARIMEERCIHALRGDIIQADAISAARAAAQQEKP